MDWKHLSSNATIFVICELVLLVPIGTISAADIIFRWDLLPPFWEKVSMLVITFMILSAVVATIIAHLAGARAVLETQCPNPKNLTCN